MVSDDAKCKVTLGEPGSPIAAVSRGKQVIVESGESLEACDHDFSNISMIPDAILIQDIPKPQVNNGEEDSDVTEGNSDNSWYRGQVYYGIKSWLRGDASQS